MTIEFNKTSKNVFDNKEVGVWLFEEDGEQLVDITEYAEDEDNCCSTAHYKIEEISYRCYQFTLVNSWGERELPTVINGETEFRRMINKF